MCGEPGPGTDRPGGFRSVWSETRQEEQIVNPCTAEHRVTITLADMGFDAFFAAQVPADSQASPWRISEVHRDRLTALSPRGSQSLTAPPGTETGAFTVGDWVLASPNRQVERLLERKSLLHRRAAGTDARQQLIAANCDTLFITTSCNDDFSPARLERFLVLAYESNCRPVILLTKADLTADPAHWLARARALDPRAACLAVDARSPRDLVRIARLCPRGQTAALVGSSGVGKTTLTNGLCARRDPTGPVRERDGRGRHVTTSRTLRPMTNGGWIIDTPGIRALRLEQAGSGLALLFADIERLAQGCRFSDCTHGQEPGCALRAATESGELDPERLERWRKLREEEARNSAALSSSRHRGREKKPAPRKPRSRPASPPPPATPTTPPGRKP